VAERNKAVLGKVDVGRSCIRFKRLADVDLKALERVVKEGAKVTAAYVKERAKAAG